MRNLTHLPLFAILLILLFGCSGSNNKDLANSPFYWSPMEVDSTKILNKEFFSKIHKDKLGEYVFANESIERDWKDASKFVTVYDMSKMDEEGLFCRLFVNQNTGPAEIFKKFSVNPGIRQNAHLRYDYYVDSLQGDYYYNYKTSKEELTWESVRYPIFEPGVLEESEVEKTEISIQQVKICEALLKNQAYIKTKNEDAVLLGLRYSLADGSSGGGWAHKKTLPLAEKQIQLINIEEGLEWISKIPRFKVPEPFESNRKLEKEALKLMRNYGNNQGWDEEFKKAIKTSDYRIKRNKFSGVIEGRTITFALIAEWPDGSWTSQYFNTYQSHLGNDKYGALNYYGTGDQQLIWGEAVDL